MTKNELKGILEGFPAESVRVRVEDGDFGKFLAEVISPSFNGMDDSDRQHKVWRYLLGKLPDDSEIEFVFTYTPDESENVSAPSNAVTVAENNVFGKRIREIRESNNKTLKEVSDHLKISISYLSDVERGNRHPFNKIMVESFSSFFSVDPLELHHLASLCRGGFMLTSNVIPKGAEVGAILFKNWTKYSESDFERLFDLVSSLSPNDK